MKLFLYLFLGFPFLPKAILVLTRECTHFRVVKLPTGIMVIHGAFRVFLGHSLAPNPRIGAKGLFQFHRLAFLIFL